MYCIRSSSAKTKKNMVMSSEQSQQGETGDKKDKKEIERKPTRTRLGLGLGLVNFVPRDSFIIVTVVFIVQLVCLAAQKTVSARRIDC